MLPRVTTETQYDRNGQPQIRYTGVWATRTLGPTTQTPEVYPTDVVSKKWEPVNTYETTTVFLFIAFFELCCALALTCLGIYHWATPGDPYQPSEGAQLMMTGLAASWTAVITVIAMWPERRGRIAKRMLVIFSIPTLFVLTNSISTISQYLAFEARAQINANGFAVAEVILASVLTILITVSLYPSSEACVPAEPQRHQGIRGTTLCLNTTVGAIVLIYLCFSIYGIHAAFEPIVAVRTRVTLLQSAMAVPITALVLLVTLGSFYAIGRSRRPHIIPYVIVGIVVLIKFLAMTEIYVVYLNELMTNDWHDNAYVAMFALNCMSIAGLAIMVALNVAFIYM